MILRQPRSTRTDPLCPYTTLVRALVRTSLGIRMEKQPLREIASGEYDTILVSGGGVEDAHCDPDIVARSEEHTSELQSLMRISYAVFCLHKKPQCQLIDYLLLYNHKYMSHVLILISYITQ